MRSQICSCGFAEIDCGKTCWCGSCVLEIEMSKPQNPWLHFAGMLKDDPYFDQMQEDIAEYRREKDAEFAIRKLRDGLNF
jgi:ferredoxin